jgi:hypothetical protein
MAQTMKISDNSWKCFFKDKKKVITTWPCNSEVAAIHNIIDKKYSGKQRKLKVKLEAKYKISETGFFTITSGKEVYFRKALRDKIENIVFNNPQSFLTITVLD